MPRIGHYVNPLLLTGLVFFAASGCRTTPRSGPAPRIVQPGAPGQESRIVGAEQARDLSRVGATPGDIKFMQGMIHHHAQAIDMTELLKTRTASDDMKKLALRIQVSQTDEIRMMQRWLQAHGAEAPDPHAMHMPGMVMPGMDHGPMMAGMLTPEEMQRLAGLKGPEFDQFFLAGMIKHHGGAILMVQELFATPGAGQESTIYAFASDVVSDQQMEIDRMSGMLAAIKERVK
ncbi:MAG: DUF305 domain-containing protein [Vicinamibacterales bacterium]